MGLRASHGHPGMTTGHDPLIPQEVASAVSGGSQADAQLAVRSARIGSVKKRTAKVSNVAVSRSRPRGCRTAGQPLLAT